MSACHTDSWKCEPVKARAFLWHLCQQAMIEINVNY